MIDHVEFAHHPFQSCLYITFFYEDGRGDTFALFGARAIEDIVAFAESEPEPEALMLVMRKIGKLTIH